MDWKAVGKAAVNPVWGAISAYQNRPQKSMSFNVGANILNPSPWTVAHAAGPELPNGYANDADGNQIYLGNTTSQNTPSPDIIDPNDYTQPTGGGTATTPDIVSLNGVDYDLNNASDRAAFYQVKSSEIDKSLREALTTGNMSYAKQLATVQDQMDQYMHDWTAQGKTLGEGYSQGVSARQQFFQGLGTRAYQSAMGTSGQNALNQLGQAQNERNYQKGIQEKTTVNAKSGLEQAFNSWQNQAAQQAQQQKDALRGTTLTIGGFNAPAQQVLGGQADLSGYTPYTNFQALSSSPMVSQQRTSQAPTQQMTLAQWLQQQPETTDVNPLNQYLQGK